ncbi:MAG: hypothetical protein JNK87_11945 [Bryobacterales bacterium]|nr:hypothetical protein [Bryobacterales bacterium]
MVTLANAKWGIAAAENEARSQGSAHDHRGVDAGDLVGACANGQCVAATKDLAKKSQPGERILISREAFRCRAMGRWLGRLV